MAAAWANARTDESLKSTGQMICLNSIMTPSVADPDRRHQETKLSLCCHVVYARGHTAA
jgi:hypothetical protein